MKGNLAQLMQQAQKMQENLQKAQQEIGKIEVTGQAGGGLVAITITGRHEVRRVAIDPQAGQDLDLLEDLVAAAFNDAVNRLQTVTRDKLSDLSGGLPLPPGFNLP